jgi:ABC-2 type transport system ATP-binding protein
MVPKIDTQIYKTNVSSYQPTPMVRLEGVTKLYKHFAAVKNLNLEVRNGEILGIIGHNGAGKTTTLKMITGLVVPTSGTIEVLGMNMRKDNRHIKGCFGYLPEESPLYENISVVEYLLFFAELYKIPRNQAREQIDRLLDALQLSEKNKLTGELSKGMRRKVAIARTLLHDPQLLILDEPNSSLDPLTSFFIIDYLKTLKDQGKTIVLSAHNLFHIEYICDRVAIMKNGELLLCDTMESIKSSFGTREFEVVFKSNEDLNYETRDNNYIFRAADVNQLAAVLNNIAEKDLALVDLSTRQSTLEEIYVKFMNESKNNL